MKRFLVLCISLLLVVSLMAVPALAASDGSFLFENNECLTNDFVPESGKLYTGRIYASFSDSGNDYAWYEFGPVELDLAQKFFSISTDIVIDGQERLFDISFDGGHGYWVCDDIAIGFGAISLSRFELTPYVPEPVTADELTDNVGSFFSGVAGWVSNLASLLQEPLVLLTVLCIPLTGVIIWAITKFKDL